VSGPTPGPTTRTLGTLAASAGATTLTPALPAQDTNPKGVILAICATKNNAVHSTATSGWVNKTQVNSGAGWTVSLWAAPAGSAAPVFTWTGSVACSAQCVYYSDPQNTMSAAGVSVLGTPGTGTTSPHTSAGANTTAAAALVAYIDACAANASAGTSAGWTELFDNGSATSVSRFVWGDKQVPTSGTASGAISITGGVAAYVQFQVQLIGDTPPAGFQVTKEFMGAWLDPPGGVDFSKMEMLVWLDTNDVRFSKLEMLAWLDPVAATGHHSMSLM
jgi:hypothetical protein